MTDLATTAQAAATLGISPRTVRNLAKRYGLGFLLGPKALVFTQKDVIVMRQHSTGVPGRPAKLSESLTMAADAAEEEAREAIRDGDGESAKTTLRIAAHLTRLANTHRASGNDPVQQIATDQSD